MMRNVNKKAINQLQGNSSSVEKKHNLGKNLIAIGLATLLITSAPVVANAAYQNGCNDYRYNHTHDYECGYYSYIPYNANWGVKDVTYLVDVSVTRNGMGVVKLSNASNELLSSIYNLLGEKKVNNSGYKYVTFDIDYEKTNDSYIIDTESFELYGKNISNLGRLTDKKVFLPSQVFMSPEGQQWVDEANYIEYVKDKVMVYEGSDGALSNSYQQFKKREIELAKNTYNPNNNNASQTIPLSQIAHYELSSDGTIWKDMTILEEYINWKSDNSYNIKNGKYYGEYGVATSFVEYVKCYNIAYFINSGLKNSEQYYGSNGFLFATQEQANKSLEKGYQKIK